MIIILGETGYMGKAFIQELKKRDINYKSISRLELDYTKFHLLYNYLKKYKFKFLINCAGYTGKPNVDSCENFRTETLVGNVLLVQNIANACSMLDIPWGHISSGCIYSGAKILKNNQFEICYDMKKSDFISTLLSNPTLINGFDESDDPNFSFNQSSCSFYSGSKALGEEVLSSYSNHYIWRLRIPFDEYDNPRNYLTKLQKYDKVYENFNSLSHRNDFVKACLDLWEKKSPFGIYNICNPGFVSTNEVVLMIEKFLKPSKIFKFWKNDNEFYQFAAKTPRSNCILDVSKLLSEGVVIRSVKEALEQALENWQSDT